MAVVVSVLWEGVVGKVADGLESFGFDVDEVGSGRAKLADVGKSRGGADIIEVEADGWCEAALDYQFDGFVIIQEGFFPGAVTSSRSHEEAQVFSDVGKGEAGPCRMAHYAYLIYVTLTYFLGI